MNKKEKLLRQEEIINTVKTAGRELSEEEQMELDSLQRDIESMEQEDAAGERSRQGIGGGIQEAGSLTLEGNLAAGADPVLLERKRAADISTVCREFGMEPERYIKGGQSVDQVREVIINDMLERHAPIPAKGRGDVTLVAASEDKFRAAAADALLMRGGLAIEKPAEGAQSLRGLSLRDLAIETLQAEGESGWNRKSSDELFNAMTRAFFNPSAAFPAIMDTAINKAYVEGHRTAAVTYDKIVKIASVKDFKTHENNYLAGPAGEFLEVPEGGELQHDLPTDAKRPTKKLRTYGRQFTMTRQAFINDDIDFLSKIPAKYAASARKTINKQVYGLLVKNPAIYDGTKLFSKAHKNILAAGTGITRESMQTMIMALQTQTDEFREAIIINPAIIVVPAGYAFDIYTIFYSPTINTSANTQSVNPLYKYKEMIEVVEDPTINVLCGGFGNVMPWWLLGAKSDTDFIEVTYLNGQEIPNVRRMETPGQLGFVWDIYLDWGVDVMDFRGAIKNPGIKLDSPLGL